MCSTTGAVYLVLLGVAVLVGCVDSINSSVAIATSYGDVLGMMGQIEVNGQIVEVETFLGIPYAKPPVGELRFRKPQRPVKWTSVFEAFQLGKACLQAVKNDTSQYPEKTSENCLYLNIWRPLCNRTSTPTIVWIHGGSLKSGSSSQPMYDGLYLAAKECVIVASMNYRLGALGFLYTPHHFSSGNMGLLDVRLAVKFIKKNVAKFGGNPRQITLVGGGAGAYIASIFLMSPLTIGLFNNVILQSGSPLMQRLYQNPQRAYLSTIELAKKLGCYDHSYRRLVNCLRRVGGYDLMAVYTDLSSNMRNEMVTVLDRYFLVTEPQEHVKELAIKDCPVIIGTNKDEGTETLLKILPQAFNAHVTQPPVFAEDVLDKTLTRFLGMKYVADFLPHLVATLKLIYNYRKMRTEPGPTVNLLSFVSRDLAYSCPMKTFIDRYSELGQNIYTYSFNHAPDNTQLPNWVGATHRTELQYLFKTSANHLPAPFSPREMILSANMQTMWADFARFGNPTPNNTVGTQWPPYTPRTSEQMLVFTEDTQLNVSAVSNRPCLFWNIIPPEMKV